MILLLMGITAVSIFVYKFYVEEGNKVFKYGTYYLLDNSYGQPDKIDRLIN